MTLTAPLRCGAAAIDISPIDSQFLYGYPDVERMSNGVHDPLFASALFLNDGRTAVMFIATDTIIAPGDVVERARQRIHEKTAVPAQHIMITASHTHSAPITQKMVSNLDDPVVPDPDPAYMKLYEDSIVAAGIKAHASAQLAEIAMAVADGSGLGTNRHDPQGPAIPRVPILSVRNADNQQMIAVMVVCNMHPTVLHEDSTLASGDFPGLARQYLQQHPITKNCPIIYHMGAAGNQSPRHVTRANTFAEAQRLGELLAKRIEALLPQMEYRSDMTLASEQVHIDLPPRDFPSAHEAQQYRDIASKRLDNLQVQNAPRTEIRTAECDYFGAQETLTLAKCNESGRLQAAIDECMPAEIHRIDVGPWTFVGWPGEVYVEFAIQIADKFPNVTLITMANNSLYGYLVTQEAVDHNFYEAGNAIFKSPDSGDFLVQHTLMLLERSI